MERHLSGERLVRIPMLSCALYQGWPQALTSITTIANEYTSDSLLTGRSVAKISGAAHRTECPLVSDAADPESEATPARPKSVSRA